MKKVIFYGRTGSEKDREQKAMLTAAGYAVETRDLTAEHWTAAGLRAYFAEKPVSEWFDPSAPEVLSGEIDPTRLNPQEALVKLSINPGLIHSPLVKYNGRCASGLEGEELQYFLDVHARGGKPASVKRPPTSWGEDAGSWE